MRIFARLTLGALLTATAAHAFAADDRVQRGEAKLARALEGRVAGKPVDCINLRDIRSSEIIDRTAILYRTSGNRLYLNRPTAGQESLDRDDILVTDTHSSQLCSIDTIKLLDRTSYFYSGFVGLGSFVPYVKSQQ